MGRFLGKKVVNKKSAHFDLKLLLWAYTNQWGSVLIFWKIDMVQSTYFDMSFQKKKFLVNLRSWFLRNDVFSRSCTYILCSYPSNNSTRKIPQPLQCLIPSNISTLQSLNPSNNLSRLKFQPVCSRSIALPLHHRNNYISVPNIFTLTVIITFIW